MGYSKTIVKKPDPTVQSLIETILSASPGDSITREFESFLEAHSIRWQLYNTIRNLLRNGFIKDKRVKIKLYSAGVGLGQTLEIQIKKGGEDGKIHSA
jgi:hypothetical protein